LLRSTIFLLDLGTIPTKWQVSSWSWLWLYGSWIHNYLCYQCLSPQKLWARTPHRQGVLDTTLCDKVCHWLASGRWYSLCIPVSSTNKTDRHDITKILWKVALYTTLTLIHAYVLIPITYSVVLYAPTNTFLFSGFRTNSMPLVATTEYNMFCPSPTLHTSGSQQSLSLFTQLSTPVAVSSRYHCSPNSSSFLLLNI
jgi:hypothetical protein